MFIQSLIQVALFSNGVFKCHNSIEQVPTLQHTYLLCSNMIIMRSEHNYYNFIRPLYCEDDALY